VTATARDRPLRRAARGSRRGKVAVEGKSSTSTEGAHERETRGVHEGVFPFVMLTEPAKRFFLLLLADGQDAYARGPLQRVEESDGARVPDTPAQKYLICLNLEVATIYRVKGGSPVTQGTMLYDVTLFRITADASPLDCRAGLVLLDTGAAVGSLIVALGSESYWGRTLALERLPPRFSARPVDGTFSRSRCLAVSSAHSIRSVVSASLSASRAALEGRSMREIIIEFLDGYGRKQKGENRET